MPLDPIGQHQRPHFYMMDGWHVCLYKGRIGWGRDMKLAWQGWWAMHSQQPVAQLIYKDPSCCDFSR